MVTSTSNDELVCVSSQLWIIATIFLAKIMEHAAVSRITTPVIALQNLKDIFVKVGLDFPFSSSVVLVTLNLRNVYSVLSLRLNLCIFRSKQQRMMLKIIL